MTFEHAIQTGIPSPVLVTPITVKLRVKTCHLNC